MMKYKTVMIKLPISTRATLGHLVSKLRVIPFLVLALLVALPHLPEQTVPVAHAALSQREIDELNAKLKETEQKLKDVKSQKDTVTNQINSEQKNQSKLAGDANYLAKVIQQTALQVEQLKLEIERLELQVQILTKEKEQLEARLADIQGKMTELNTELTASMNLLYKMSLNSPNFLEANTNFEDSVVSQEKQKSLIALVKKNLAEVKKLQEEVQAKKDEIAAKEKEVSNYKSEKLAQSESLQQNQKGLEWQQKNKLAMLEESKKKATLLNEKKTTIDQQIRQYEADLNALRNALYLMPPSGTPIAAGQYIGAVGRTGLSCDWGKPDQLPANYINYCSYLGSNWYYYPTSLYPTKGAHLHFELRLRGANTNADPAKYLNTFNRNPVDWMNISNSFSSWHNGIDLAPGYGKPVYAVKPGKIIYRCDSFPDDPAYGAVIYHDDGSITQYWHLQRPAHVRC